MTARGIVFNVVAITEIGEARKRPPVFTNSPNVERWVSNELVNMTSFVFECKCSFFAEIRPEPIIDDKGIRLVVCGSDRKVVSPRMDMHGGVHEDEPRL